MIDLFFVDNPIAKRPTGAKRSGEKMKGKMAKVSCYMSRKI